MNKDIFKLFIRYLITELTKTPSETVTHPKLGTLAQTR